MYVINPDPYSLPCYRIGPFQTGDLSINHTLPDSSLIDDYLKDRFGSNEIIYTENGRRAINLALSYYNLDKSDVVTILTTSGNFYISGCVTREIEKFCKWSRKIEAETKILFINHEFGYIYPEMDYLASLGFPIIEDCCTTFFSQNRDKRVGTYGDFSVYSFPKFFPIQIGGFLVNNRSVSLEISSYLDPISKNHIKAVLSHYIGSIDDILSRRSTVYKFGIERYMKLGFSERFEKDDLTVPSVMLLKNNEIIKDLPALKSVLWNHGIQSSIFYGEDTFFIPSHQNLRESDVYYFETVLRTQIANKS